MLTLEHSKATSVQWPQIHIFQGSRLTATTNYQTHIFQGNRPTAMTHYQIHIFQGNRPTAMTHYQIHIFQGNRLTAMCQWHTTRLSVFKGNRLRALTYIFHWFPPEECREWWSPAPGACLCGYCWNSTLAVPAWSRESPTLTNKGGLYFSMLHGHHNL